ncbi:uncharacterized protein LOC121389688 [Gigantopelta aegis]|uniref:uncharacterized protein LOC121389688 n=1 Tax=Gigantopelta aegis TaxID=1735272 RepID=UPI001B88A029|nr:uncharacterized protein LOC121389688 [Gigantopelta aegis]
MAGLRRIEFVQSQKGSPQVILDGFLFAKNRTRGESVHWRCVTKTCTGKCTTVGEFVRNTSEHNHLPSDSNVARFISILRKRAREETTPMQQIYNDEVAKQALETVPHLPSFPSMSSALYRQRRVLIPALPQTRADVILEEPWTQTNDGRRYLLFSDGNEDNMLVFSTDEQIVALQAAESIFMDGTFSSCPALWNQLYIIHAMDGTTMYPLVFALLPDKQRITYIRLFSLLKNEVQQLLNQPLAPSKVQTDFEMAAIQAVETEFPQAEVKGCFFHFTQAIWRKTQELGLAVLYKEDPAVQTWIRRAAGLPLLSIAQVQDAWLEAMNDGPDVPQAEAFNDYVVLTWVDDDSRFPLIVWNHHLTTSPRTNNNLEGFHSRMNRSIQVHHPNIYRFVELIKGIETSERAKLRQINFGAAPPPRKRVYKQNENRIVRLKAQLTLEQKTPIQFLDAVGHLLKLV